MWRAASRSPGRMRRCVTDSWHSGASAPPNLPGRAPLVKQWRSMRRLWTSAAILAAACVSFDPVGPPVRDIAGTYAGTAVIRLANTFESRTDTLTLELTLRNTGYRGGIAGTYHVAMGETGPFAGTMRTNDSLTVLVFGD